MKIRNHRLPLLLSLAIHGLLACVLFLQPGIKMPEHRKMVEVELMDPEKLLEKMAQQQASEIAEPKGQIVEQDKERINDEIDKDARFLSRHNQKVVQETQAQLHGKFKNSDNTGGAKAFEKNLGKEVEEKTAERDDNPEEKTKPAEKVAEEKEKPKEIYTAEGGVASDSKKPSLKDLMPSFKPGPPRIDSEALAKGGGEGPSASDDHLKNMKTGMQTLLSTREFVYFSYYNRIKDKLRQYWEPKIKEKMERIVRQGRTIASSQDRITRVVIVLNEAGTLVGVQVLSASGVRDLDDAAIEAFRAAAPFPNPPKGIVDQDGTIKIRWDFILEADNNGFFKAVRTAFREDS